MCLPMSINLAITQTHLCSASQAPPDMPRISTHSTIQIVLSNRPTHTRRYIADLVSDMRNPKTAREGTQSRLLFKKRMFRETDEAISEPQFINLSYVQAQHDYLQVTGCTLCGGPCAARG